MNRVPVQSSLIHSIGYRVADGLLEVQFHDGSIYHYFGVPETAYMALRKADSLGGYLNAHIKGTYPFEQVA